MKEKISKSVLFISVLIISIILCGFYLLNLVSKSNIFIKNNTVEEVGDYTEYDFSKLSKDGDIISYNDDKYTSIFGIDVAAHQDKIDWQKVKQAGVQFAYIRLGYRGATEGKLNIDEEFENNYYGATKNGIKVGVYWYSQPIDEKEAIEEAEFVYSVLNGRHLDLPIAYDFEETEFYDGTLSRMHGMDKDTRSKVALAFLNAMKEKNMDTIIYTYPYWYDNYYDLDLLSDYNLWFAQYSDYPEINSPIVIWQYSNTGNIDGIKNNCDLDIMFMKNLDQN